MALTNFAGAVAVITGRASGIGMATARALHTRGTAEIMPGESYLRRATRSVEQQVAQRSQQ